MSIDLRTSLTGSLGAPDQPENSLEFLTFISGTQQKQLPVIDMLHAMSRKLNAYFARQGPNDYRDIEWLILTFPQKIHEIRNQLNKTHREYFVGSFTQGNAENAVKRIKFVLNVT